MITEVVGVVVNIELCGETKTELMNAVSGKLRTVVMGTPMTAMSMTAMLGKPGRNVLNRHEIFVLGDSIFLRYFFLAG